MFRFWLCNLLVVLVLVAGGGELHAAAKPQSYAAVSDSGKNVVLTLDAAVPEVMKPLPVTLRVTAPDGAPVSPAAVSCALTMPAMAMPTNRPPLKATAQPGVYQGIFLLTMGGLWHAEMTLEYRDGESETVVIPIPGVASASGEQGVGEKLEELFHGEAKK